MPTPVTAMAGAGWEVGRKAAMLDSRGENAGVWGIPAPCEGTYRKTDELGWKWQRSRMTVR